MRIWPVFIGFAAAGALAAAHARGDEPVPAGIPELVGARGLAMSAYRGIGGSNDAMFGNPGALASRRRYSVETQWMIDRAGGATAFQGFGASVVDSTTSSFTGGFAYTRIPSGLWQGNLYDVALAFPLAESLYLGATGKYGSLSGPANQHMSAGSVDAGAFWQASKLISLGVAGYNLIYAGHRAVLPRGLGAGVALGDERRFQIAADYRADFDRGPGGKTTSLYAVGAEVLLIEMLPVRGGYLHDETRHASYWSAGVGFVTTSGVAIDASFRQGIDRSDDRTFAVGVKLFLFQ